MLKSINLIVVVLLLLQSMLCSAKQVTKEQSLNIAKQFNSLQRTSKNFYKHKLKKK